LSSIVAIGGGELGLRETIEIDRLIVALASKRRPRALFVPTASGDAPGYCETFDRIYGEELGCDTASLLLLGRDRDPERARVAIAEADIIYVGGGSTLRMMRVWRRLGVDAMLIDAADRGTIMSGLSAGAICWHQWGHSDSMSFTGRDDWEYIRVRALGIVPGLFAPHLDAESRLEPLKQMLKRYGGRAIGADNCAAIVYRNGTVTCRANGPNPRIHLLEKNRNGITHRTFAHGEEIE
jgi:dipeptidase E